MNENEMAPAFSSPRQAIAFAVLLVALLAIPGLSGSLIHFPRWHAYASMPILPGPFSFMQHQIFDEKADVDIAFIGSSKIMCSIDTYYVQRKMTEKLGREARVISLGSLAVAKDRDYFILRDLLAHRRVRMVILNMEEDWSPLNAEPYSLSELFFPVEPLREDLVGLPLRWRAALYGKAILGTPRKLLNLLLPPLPHNSPETKDLGMRPRRLGYSLQGDESSFKLFTHPPPSIAPDSIIYSPNTRQNFNFGDGKLDPYTSHFVRKIGNLVHEYKTHLVILDIPQRILDDAVRQAHLPLDRTLGAKEPPFIKLSVVPEFTFWPNLLGAQTDLVGVPRARLFAGLSDDEIKMLYADRSHLNLNGNTLFTQTITPALLRLYDEVPIRP